MSKKNEKKKIEDMPFDEALARFIQTDPKELEDVLDKIRREEEGVEQYVKERQESIRRGARRAPKRFRP